MFPPMLLYMRIGTPERPGLPLWLPLFLVWLILLPIIVLILAVTVVADVVLFLGGYSYHDYTLLLFRCLGVLAATHGSSVHIAAKGNVIDLEFV